MDGKELQQLRHEYGLSQQVLSKKTGIPLGSIARFEATGMPIKKVETYKKLQQFFENEANRAVKSPETVRSFTQSQRNFTQSESLEPDDNGDKIPMYNLAASASNIEMYNDGENKVIGYLNIPGATKNSYAIPVVGHSMYPTLANGAWGVVRPCEDRLDIEWGQVYYIEYGDYRVWKRLIKDDENSDNVILASDNVSELVNGKLKYAPKTIKADRITKLSLLTFVLIKTND